MITRRACTVAGCLVAIGVLVSVACERTARREAPTVTINDEELPSDADRTAERFADAEPDWTVVEDYLEWQGAGAEPDGALPETATSRPDASRAIAAARAILEAGGLHPKTVEAAEFLILRVALDGDGDADQHAHAGAKALLEHAPGYGEWPRVLNRMHHRRALGAAVDAFFEDLASWAEDPVLRATGQYYVAAGLMRSANESLGTAADAEDLRQRALEAAVGLSAGVEQDRFLGTIPNSRSESVTLAEAEADLIRSIKHGTVAGTLPDLIGTRLDGAEDRLSSYRGRVVLLDFWATWCPPCRTALPKLRELVAELPADRFALIAVSVDEEPETASRFMADEPMPWVNWHAGTEGEIAQLLRVSFFPTYVLADEHGRILARSNVLEGFRPLIDEALAEGG